VHINCNRPFSFLNAQIHSRIWAQRPSPYCLHFLPSAEIDRPLANEGLGLIAKAVLPAFKGSLKEEPVGWCAGLTVLIIPCQENDTMSEKIVVKNLYKVFGPNPQRAFKLIERGYSKDEIFEKTGLNVGVQDANFSINAGEIFVVMGLSGSGKSTHATSPP